MPRHIEFAPPQKAIDAVAGARHAVELPYHELPPIPEHPAPEGELELAPVELLGHPASQAIEHLPSLEAPELPAVELPEQAMAEVIPPMAHLPEFIFDIL